jgi:hypothetical protein
MILLAKVAIGFGGTMLLAGVYTFHDGILRVDAEQEGGQHVHVWAPAAIVPIALHVVPNDQIGHVTEQMGPWLPTLRALTKELKKYPEAEFVDVHDGGNKVRVRMHGGKLTIDVDEPGEQVHVACPLAMIEDVSRELAGRGPAI